jgi:amino acid efflux transporter
MAVVSVVLVAGLVALGGPYLVVPALLALVAVMVAVAKRARRKESADV